jgi:hypothetical protein
MDAVPDDLKSSLRDVLFGLAAADPDRAARFAADAFAKFGDAVLAAADEADLLPRLPALRDALLGRARTEGLPAARRFDDARKALSASRETNDYDRAREAFDVLEELAARTAAERAKLIQLIGDAEEWESVWDPYELRFALVPLLLQEGQAENAAHLQLQAARDLVARRDEGSLDLAREAVEQAALWGVEAPPDLRRALAPRTAQPSRARRPCGRVLFVGGNETQERYDDYLQETVRNRWPDVSLDLVYPGWSSNWGRDVPALAGRIEAAGAVVLMRFVRTLFGHGLRALCSQYGRRWVPCTGHGRDSMLRSIERAVAFLPSRS